MSNDSVNPNSIHIHGYRIVFSNKGNTAKATRISGVGKEYIKVVDLVNYMTKLNFLLSRPNKIEPEALVFRKK